jgi:glycosyltransferase involved in cell wall biosynthesis
MHAGVFLGEFRPDVGGGYTFVNEVAEAFLAVASESPHHFSIFCPPDAATHLRTHGLPANVAVVELAQRGLIGRAIATLKHVTPVFGYVWRWPCALERAARAHGVEIMWFVGGFFDTLDMPYIATVWDAQHLTHPWFPEVSAQWRWEYRELFLQRHLRRAARVITGTEVGKNELMSFYRLPTDRISILPHPTPSFALSALATQGASAVERFGLTKDYLLYPAQFWAHKNHVNLLLALKCLLERGNDVPDLVLLGSDKGNKCFVQNKAAELGLSDRVRFLGFMSTEELVSLYQHAGALVYPSFSGPENLPPLEAFALGCPVVASDFPGAREQLDDAALLFDPHDPVSMASAISRALGDDTLRVRLVELGKQRARRWTGRDYARGVMRMIDEFEPVRRTWE